MDFRQYQEAAKRTASLKVSGMHAMTNWALGLAGESGEVADVVKKVAFHDHPLDTMVLANELGDVLYYLAAMANELGLSLEAIAEANIKKLAMRYPNGFDPERSRNREGGSGSWQSVNPWDPATRDS